MHKSLRYFNFDCLICYDLWEFVWICRLIMHKSLRYCNFDCLIFYYWWEFVWICRCIHEENWIGKIRGAFEGSEMVLGRRKCDSDSRFSRAYICQIFGGTCGDKRTLVSLPFLQYLFFSYSCWSGHWKEGRYSLLTFLSPVLENSFMYEGILSHVPF